MTAPEQREMPKRIQLSRKKGWRKPEGAIVVSRPSKWGNPFRVGDPLGTPWTWISEFGETVRTVEEAVRLHELWLRTTPLLEDIVRKDLAGKDLCCWCGLDGPCHADTLLRVANGGPDA